MSETKAECTLAKDGSILYYIWRNAGGEVRLYPHDTSGRPISVYIHGTLSATEALLLTSSIKEAAAFSGG